MQNIILWHYPAHGKISHDRSSMMLTPGIPFGIPEHITRWAIEVFSLTHQRLTHPRCESQDKGLRPTYWEWDITKIKINHAMGTQEILNTEHWSMYPSMMTFTTIETNAIKR